MGLAVNANQPHGTGEKPRISPEERQRREEAVNYGMASVGLEGFTISDEQRAHAQRFIDGEIDLAEFVKVRHG